MTAVSFRVWAAIVLFVVTFATGFLLAQQGKPYASTGITLHKLVSLAGGVFLFLALRQLLSLDQLQPLLLVLLAAAAILFIGLLVTGGLLSTNNPMPTVVLVLHRILPYVFVLVASILLYQLY